MRLTTRVQLVRDSETGHRAPYLLHVSTSHFARVNVPRDFRGLLSLSTNRGNLRISPQLLKETAIFSEDGTERRCFVGSLTHADRGGREWTGDEVKVEIIKPSLDKGLWVGYVGETDSWQERPFYKNPYIVAVIILIIWVLLNR